MVRALLRTQSPDEPGALLTDLKREGYVQVPDAFGEVCTAPIRDAVSTLWQRGIPLPFDPGRMPTFTERLGLIGKQVLQYRHMYPLGDDVAAVATTLFDSYMPRTPISIRG